MLVSRATGERREVDVVIRASAGYPVVLSVEAASRSRKADRTWVDTMLGKHADLETNKLILVAERGFTKDAREAAEASGALPLSPDDFTGEDPAFEIVNALPSLWPKHVSFTPEEAIIAVDQPTSGVGRFKAPPDLHIFSEDGEELDALLPVIHDIYRVSAPLQECRSGRRSALPRKLVDALGARQVGVRRFTREAPVGQILDRAAEPVGRIFPPLEADAAGIHLPPLATHARPAVSQLWTTCWKCGLPRSEARRFSRRRLIEAKAELEAIVADYVQKRRDRPRPGRLKCARPCVLRGGAEQRADVAIGSEMQLSLAQPGQIRHACRIKRGPIRGEDRSASRARRAAQSARWG